MTEGYKARYERVLTQGATVPELMEIFRVTRKACVARIGDTKPTHTIDDVGPIWDIQLVAPMIRPLDDKQITQRLIHTNHIDLPPTLKKDFWVAEANRLKVQEIQGDLWSSERIMEVFSDSFKVVRSLLMLLQDNVDREDQLSDLQVAVIKRLVDSTMGSLDASLEKLYGKGGRGQRAPGGGESERRTEEVRFSIDGRILGPDDPEYDL